MVVVVMIMIFVVGMRASELGLSHEIQAFQHADAG
jgi:hypothetical protein